MTHDVEDRPFVTFCENMRDLKLPLMDKQDNNYQYNCGNETETS